MLLKLEYLATAAAVAAFAYPAAAQDAAVDAAAETPVQAGADVGVDADANLEAEVGTSAEAQGGPEGEADADAGATGAGEIVVATPADVRTGVVVLDPQGGVVGTVEQVEADGAVVSTGTVRAKMPVESFGKNDRGLVISMTRAEFEAAVAAQNPS